jgi:pimeloyl-ACP methyl ester carboxylesterase
MVKASSNLGTASMKRVFAIHGWTYNLNKWSDLSKALYQRGVELVLLKVPGLTMPSDKVWTINDYVEWLNNNLNGVANPIVIGHSNGGRIALCYVQKYPGKLAQLILIDSAGVAHDQKQSLRKLKVLKALSNIGKPLGNVPGARQAFYKVIGARDYYEAPPNMRLTMQNMLAADRSIDFGSIKLPVSIIWGENDKITPIADGHKIHASIAGSTFEIVPEATHSPFYNHPDKVADIIIRAIGKT